MNVTLVGSTYVSVCNADTLVRTTVGGQECPPYAGGPSKKRQVHRPKFIRVHWRPFAVELNCFTSVQPLDVQFSGQRFDVLAMFGNGLMADAEAVPIRFATSRPRPRQNSSRASKRWSRSGPARAAAFELPCSRKTY